VVRAGTSKSGLHNKPARLRCSRGVCLGPCYRRRRRRRRRRRIRRRRIRRRRKRRRRRIRRRRRRIRRRRRRRSSFKLSRNLLGIIPVVDSTNSIT
jgi:hypothetical protein